jgi:predicted RND superfamily exporter protein
MFGKLPSLAMNRPVYWVAAFVLLTVVWCLGLGRLRIRTEGTAIYPAGNEVIRQTAEDNQIFLDPQELVLLITTQSPEEHSFTSPAGLLYLKKIHESLSKLEGLHPTKVFSLASIPDSYIRKVYTILDTIPTDPSAFEALLEKIRDDPVAHGLLISPDGDAAAFYVNFEVDRKPRDVILTLQSWIDSQDEAGYDLHFLGPLAAETTLGEMVLQDLARLIPIMVAVIAFLLLLFLRSPGGVLIPMIEALMVLLWIFGAMGYCGVPVTLVTTILPVVLMVMGITDEIHLLERLQAHLAMAKPVEPGCTAARARIRDAMLASLREIGRPIIATSITTALAFLSFLSASISPIRQFGLFASLGILLAMFLTFTFIPALAVILPVSWLLPRKPRKSGHGFHSLFLWEKRAARQEGRAWIVGLLLLVLGLPGILLLSVQDSWVGNFDPDSSLPLADRRFNEEFWGSYRYDVVFEGERWFFYLPEGAGLIEDFTRIAEEGPHVGGVLSHLTIFGEVADKFRYARPISSLNWRKIRTLATGATAGMGSPFMKRLVTITASSTRVRIFVNRATYKRGLALEEYLEPRLRSLIEGGYKEHYVEYHFSGDLPAAVEVVRATVINQLRSIGWTLLGIFLLLLLAFRTIRGVLIVMVPVLAADWILFAGLGYAGVPLGIATSMFASLTIGVGIDYALHLRYSYRRNIATEPDHTSAMVRSLGSTGRAIRLNAFALGIGLLVLSFSSIPPNRALGVLLASAMITCYGTTLLLLPRLLRFTSLQGASRRSS